MFSNRVLSVASAFCFQVHGSWHLKRGSGVFFFMAGFGGEANFRDLALRFGTCRKGEESNSQGGQSRKEEGSRIRQKLLQKRRVWNWKNSKLKNLQIGLQWTKQFDHFDNMNSKVANCSVTASFSDFNFVCLWDLRRNWRAVPRSALSTIGVSSACAWHVAQSRGLKK